MNAIPPVRVLQFGTGVLLRGLCDEIIDRALADPAHPWDGAVAVVQSTGVERADMLARTDRRYTVFTRGQRGGQPVHSERSVGCITQAFAAQRDWADVLAVAASPDLRSILSNTTETGLRSSPADAPGDAVPKSYPAKLLRVLATRHQAGAAAPVVVPCELIERNGAALRNEVLALAERLGTDPSVTHWIADEVVFANTLVDRICTRPVDPNQNGLGVVVEPFAQWVIEAPSDRWHDLEFAAGIDGAQLVSDVTPYFVRKVRVLNGAHTAVVNLGLLAGHETMRVMLTDNLFVRFLRAVLWKEILPPLVAARIPGVEQFSSDVLDRFANPYTAHKLADIADGTAQKLEIRLLPTIAAYGDPPPCICLGIAAWLARSGTAPGEGWAASTRDAVEHWRRRLHHAGVRDAMESAIRASGG